ncbi:DUF5079 family protein [Staphylococcus edaphicus]|uniref:DUF5079 family protein n=3 Tax=Staphylococcus edaphicus TaxID=1955013 RepID=A0ABY4QE44_9STAP|nr:DUF5079 family protein [Staphylococcus edaphicus]UQW81656.1 DUF5079 family protein [Staphylococcus edaphicus]
MNLNKSIDELRKPATQAVSLITLFIILFSSLTLLFGLEYENVTFYLKIVTIIELIIIGVSLLQYIRFINFKDENLVNKKILKNYARFLTVVNIVGTYNVVFAFSNVFYFVALQNDIDLYKYWLLNFVTMLVCFLLFTLGGVFFILNINFLKNYISPKLQTAVGLLLMFVSQFIIIEKVIEYILVPNIADSKFVILAVIVFVIVAYYMNVLWLMKYADFKILVLKE